MEINYPVSEKHRAAVLWLALATASWGLSFPIQKALFLVQQRLVPEAGTWFLSSWVICLRSLLAAVLFLLFRPSLLRGLRRKEWQQGAMLGLFGGAGLILQADGLAHTEASTSAFLTQAYCIILPLWQCFSRKARPGLRLLSATALVLWGITILSGFHWTSFSMGRGELETLGSALMFTVQIILLERPAFRQNRMMPVSVLMFAGFALCSLPVALLAAPSAAALTQVLAGPHVWVLLLILVVACTMFSYGMMNLWQPHVAAAEAGLIYCIEPVFAAGYALFMPAMLSVWAGISYANETLTTSLITGGVLITVANVILQLRPPNR